VARSTADTFIARRYAAKDVTDIISCFRMAKCET